MNAKLICQTVGVALTILGSLYYSCYIVRNVGGTPTVKALVDYLHDLFDMRVVSFRLR
jgi:hypothetical protein